jgi:hypothetical protein
LVCIYHLVQSNRLSDPSITTALGECVTGFPIRKFVLIDAKMDATFTFRALDRASQSPVCVYVCFWLQTPGRPAESEKAAANKKHNESVAAVLGAQAMK